MPAATEDLKDYLKSAAAAVDAALDREMPAEDLRPATIHKAMRYAIFAGGKRLRPVLCLAATETCGGTWEPALPAACALEMMHTYSLVHDDLPAMDDDDLRRGRPTCHKVYGEGIAVLTGDALLTEAFAVLARSTPPAPYSALDLVTEFASTGGSQKLIGGQVLDLEGEGQSLGQDDLVAIHENKTAALLTSSVRFGGICAGATPEQLEALTRFGYNTGLAFQVIDDILDVTQSTEQLGKTAAKDLAAEKSTYPALLGLDGARAEAKRLTTAALDALAIFGDQAARLEQIARYMLDRDY